MTDKRLRRTCVILLTIAFFIFQMYLALVKQMTLMLQTPIHMCFALALVYIYNPADKGYLKKLRKRCEAEGRRATEAETNKWAWTRWLDVVFYAAIIYVLVYTVTNIGRLQSYDMAVMKPVMADNIAMVCVVILLLEAVRRTLGNVLLFFIIAFIIFSWVSPFLPEGVLRTVATAKNKTFPKMFEKFVEGMTMAEQGIYGTPLQTSCTSLFYFIVFGAFFSECGGGQLLIDVGMKFSNKSSGGQIMPPIMGVGAFIMAEQLGINYLTVAADAILPAIAYYFGVFVLVGCLARKRASRAGGSEDAKIEVKRALLPRMYLLIPVVVLIVAILNGFSLMRAGMFGIFTCLLCNLVSFFLGLKKSGKDVKTLLMDGCKEANFAGLRQMGQCCLDGAKSAAEIAIPTAACGIIINVMTAQTSLATNLAGVIGSIGLSNLFVAMLIAMIGCMLLGMALPTVAGFFKMNMNPVERAGTFVAAMLLMTPELITSLIGIVVGVAFLLLNAMRAKKAA